MSAPPPPAPPPDAARLHARMGHSEIYETPGPDPAYVWRSGFTVDADGHPRCYHPDSDPGLDVLKCAGRPGHWWGIETATGQPSGRALVQGPRDPAPGFYISTTSLEDRRAPAGSCSRWVHAGIVPYVVLPGLDAFRPCRPGDFALVYNEKNERSSLAIYADAGPPDHLGEGSMALAAALGIDDSPRHGGQGSGVCWAVWPGSGSGWLLPDLWWARAGALAARWGGLNRLLALRKAHLA